MMTIAEALQLIEGNSKRGHSIMVGRVMKELARQLDADETLWELVGILHDLDYDETINDRSKHGVIGASRLEGRLPSDGLNAIKRHDYRTGLIPDTELDRSQVFADAFSVIFEEGNLNAGITMEEFQEVVSTVSEDRPWLKKIIEGYSFRVDVLHLLMKLL